MQRKLLVYSSGDFARTIKLLLEVEGYDVITLLNKASLMNELSKSPDLILLDVDLHNENDNKEICKQIRENSIRETAIVLMSVNDTILMKYKEYEGTDFLHKPFEASELIKKISEHLF